MNNETAEIIPKERREFFWSARTLRCDVWVIDEAGEWWLDRTEDCLRVDHIRCIVAMEPYDKLIPELLNKHFGGRPDVG